MDRGAGKDRRDLMNTVTIVIPVYNEGGNIVQTMQAIANALPERNYSVSVIYDSPDDTTLPPLDRVIPDLPFPVRKIQNRYGRGALNAIKTGMETAETEYVIVTMADLSDPPEVIQSMISEAETNQADIVCGSRYMKGGAQYGGPWLKGLMSRTAGLLLHYLAGLPTHDPTNSFKLYRKSFLDQMTIESTGGFEIGIELVVKAWKNGYKVSQVPTTWRDRSDGESHFKLFGWLSSYLRWFFAAFTMKRKTNQGRGNAG